jgi:hypothetical protein
VEHDEEEEQDPEGITSVTWSTTKRRNRIQRASPASRGARRGGGTGSRGHHQRHVEHEEEEEQDPEGITSVTWSTKRRRNRIQRASPASRGARRGGGTGSRGHHQRHVEHDEEEEQDPEGITSVTWSTTKRRNRIQRASPASRGARRGGVTTHSAMSYQRPSEPLVPVERPASRPNFGQLSNRLFLGRFLCGSGPCVSTVSEARGSKTKPHTGGSFASRGPERLCCRAVPIPAVDEGRFTPRAPPCSYSLIMILLDSIGTNQLNDASPRRLAVTAAPQLLAPMACRSHL